MLECSAANAINGKFGGKEHADLSVVERREVAVVLSGVEVGAPVIGLQTRE